MTSATESPQATGASAQEQEVHEGVKCEGCGMDPIVGERYKCDRYWCDTNLCERCKTNGVTTDYLNAHHPMTKVCASQQQPHYLLTDPVRLSVTLFGAL